MNLPSFTVKNWTGSQSMNVRADNFDPGKPTVNLSSSADGFSFGFYATPTQARELADALHACANSLEIEVMEVAA
jgi:hypothetical protein